MKRAEGVRYERKDRVVGARSLDVTNKESVEKGNDSLTIPL